MQFMLNCLPAVTVQQHNLYPLCKASHRAAVMTFPPWFLLICFELTEWKVVWCFAAEVHPFKDLTSCLILDAPLHVTVVLNCVCQQSVSFNKSSCSIVTFPGFLHALLTVLPWLNRRCCYDNLIVRFTDIFN